MTRLWENWNSLSEHGIDYAAGEVLLFYGYAGVGKTRFSSYFPIILLYRELKVKNLLTDKTRFVVINTDYSFSHDDLATLCAGNRIEYRNIEKHLWVERVKTQIDMLSIARTVFKAIKDDKMDVKLIAVDKINDPYYEDMVSYTDKRTFLAFTKELTGQLVDFIKQLMAYANRYGIIVTWSARRRKQLDGASLSKWYNDIYAGYILQYAPAVAVRLEKLDPNTNNVLLKIVKNRHGREGDEIRVEFTDYGFST